MLIVDIPIGSVALIGTLYVYSYLLLVVISMQISIVLLTLFPLLLSINGYHVRKLPLVRYNCAACPSTTANTRNYERLRTALHESVVPEQKDGSLRCARPANGFLQKLKEITKAQIVQRWITGLSLGAIGTLWIVSGNGVFTLGFLLTTLIAQNEYYNMVRKTGVMPANKTGTLASLACYVTAAMVPNFHELVMPLSSIFLMMWLLIFNKKSPSISEISTSLLGMFYIGYLPSFWVRLRSIDQLAALRVNWFNLPQVLSPDMWTVGAVVTWWTWTSIVFSGISVLLYVVLRQ